MIVYKIVREAKPHFISCNVLGVASVTYKIGVRIRAPRILAKQGYYLLVFDNLLRAKGYARGLGSEGVILKCEAGTVVSLPPYCNLFDVDEGKLHPTGDSWPDKSIMVKTLVPLEVAL